MQCSRCGAQIDAGDRFCMNCGQPVVAVPAVPLPPEATPVPQTVAASPGVTASVMPASGMAMSDTVQPGVMQPGVVQSGVMPSGAASERAAGTTAVSAVLCPACGQPVDSTMRFCLNCGAPLSPSAGVADGADTTRADDSASKAGKSKVPMIIGIVIAVIVVLAAAGFGVWWFLLRDSVSSPAHGQSQSSQQSSDTAKSSNGSDGTAPDNGENGEQKSQPCTTAPDATLDAADRNGTSLIATLRLTSNCKASSSQTVTFKESGVKITIKEDGGDVFASAVFDFSKQPVEFDDGQASVKLAFTTKQYWRPFDEIETGSSECVMQTDQSGSGAASANVGDALGGANIADSDIERYAQVALSWQVDHDKAAASGFYTTYTTQLSSKKYGMQAEGRTWRYQDIYEQFLQRRSKHGKAILVWSGDYPTYTKGGKSSDYYVILSGESFGSVDAGDAWCRQTGYGEADCLTVDLQ